MKFHNTEQEQKGTETLREKLKDIRQIAGNLKCRK